ncbi:AAA family ATPase [Candidatus Acetothermia bacterium]|nr:AAA family ATPase [Candidatus Acetothermia bacterium]
MLHIHLLGEFQLRNAQGKSLGLNTRKTQWLLAYLLLHPGPHQRERLSGLFWPDSEQLKADSSLRQAVHSLRSILEPDNALRRAYLFMERGILQFNDQGAYCLDTAEFERLLKESEKLDGSKKAEALQKAIALYRGDLLEGCYEDWCLEARDYFRERYLEALQQLVAHHAERKEFSPAIGYAKQLLVKSSLQEEIHRELMYLYYASGDRNAALQQYRECERILKAELNVEPLPETKALYHKIEERASLARLEEMAIHARELIRRYPELGAPFVGRADEWQQLVTAWDEAKQGKGRALFIAGEAGVGKSRLAQEFVSYVSNQGALILSGRSYEIEGKLPYQALIDAIRAGLAQVSSEALKKIPALWLGEIIKLLPELREKISDVRPSVELQSREQERNRLFEGLHQFLSGLSQEKPLVIFLDDLQWADESTLEFAHYLIRRLSDKKILLVGAYRVEETNEDDVLWKVLQQLTRDHLAMTLNLSPLQDAETKELVESMLDAKELEELGQWVYGQSKGVPFFAVELVKALIESGVLSLDAQGQWQIERTRSLSDYIPSTVRALVETQLRRLNRSSRQAIDIASVMGRAFTTEILTPVSGRPLEDVFDQIEDLLRAHLIVADQSQYQFRHDVIRQVAYSSLLPERRQSLHKNVGEVLERVHEQQLDKAAAELAYHFLQAGSWVKALDYSLRAGEVAKKAYANQEAITHFKQAAELAERLGKKEALREAYASLGHVCVYSGKQDEGIEYCRKALDLTSDVHARAGIYETMANGYNYSREFEKALSCCEQAIKDLGDKDNSLEMAKICDVAAQMLCQLSRFEEAIYYCKRGLEILEGSEEHSTIAMIFTHLGMIHRYQWNFEQAIEIDLQAVKAAEKSGDIYAYAEACYEAGFAYSTKGDGAHAVEFLTKALSIYRQLRDFSAMIWTYRVICRAYIQSSDLDEAIKYAESSLELANQLSKEREAATSQGFLGCLWLAKGSEQAQDYFRRAMKIAASDGRFYIEIARVFILLERPDDALKWLIKGAPHMTSGHITNAELSPPLKPLLKHPRFIQSLQGGLSR